MKKTYLKKAILPAVACLAVSGSVWAQGLDKYTFDEYVVTDARVAVKLSETPANVTVIGQDKIEKGNYLKLQDVLKDVPGVQISQSGMGATNMGKDEIYINGDKRVLVLIDDRRMNLAGDGLHSANWMPPMEAIERVEVIKGASSAMYGSDAVGGVINVILKSGGEQKSSFKMGYGSFGTQDYTLSTGGKNKGFGYYVTASLQKRGDFSYKSIGGGSTDSMHNSDYENTMVIVKLDKEVGKNKKLTFNYEHMGINAAVPMDYSGYLSDENTQRYSNNLAIKYDWGLDTERAGFVQLYQNYQHALFNSGNIYNKSDFSERTWGLTAQQNIQTHKNNQLTFGVDWRNSKVDNPAMFNGETKAIDNKAIFVEDRFKFGRGWQLNTALRYDHHNEFGSKTTMHAALNKKFSEDSNAYISWGQVFRAPAAQELYWNQPGAGTMGNPNLKPESGNVFTVGYNTKIAKTNIGVNAFYSEMKDAINWAFDGAFYSPLNVNQEKRRGLELNINHKFDQTWSLFAGYTYLNVRQKLGNAADYSPSPYTKPNNYRFGVTYDKAAWTVNAILRGASGQQASQYAKASYFTLDLNAQYKISKNAKAYLNIYNLNNAAYAEAPGTFENTANPLKVGELKYPMPSRTIIGGVQFTF